LLFQPCAATYDLMTNHIPGVLNGHDGIFGENVANLLAAIFKPYRDMSNCTIPGVPAAAANM
jgi:hypothetical protein